MGRHLLWFFCGLSATRGAFRLGAAQPHQAERSCGQSGGGRGMVRSSFRSFLSLSGFPPGARRKGSVVVGTQRALSSGQAGAGRRGSRAALVGAGSGAGRGRGAGRGAFAGAGLPPAARGLFPPAQAHLRSFWAELQDKKHGSFSVVFDTSGPGKRPYAHE